jgi:hypothetical protein
MKPTCPLSRLGVMVFSVIIALASHQVFADGLVTVTLSSSGVIGSSATKSITWLHTDGKYLRNEYGETVHLRGEVWSELVDSDHWDYAWPVSERAKNLKSYGGNVVAVKVAFQRIYNLTTTFPYYSSKTLLALDEAVNAAQQNSIYVFIVPHHDADTYSWIVDDNHLQEYIDWFVWLVNRYVDKPEFFGVYFWNEPFGIENYYYWINEWITAVHNANPNIICIFSELGYGGIPINANELVDPTQHNNFMWAFHHYFWLFDYNKPHYKTYYEVQYEGRDPQEGFATAREQYKDYLLNVRNLKAIYNNTFPIMDDEFGYFGANCPQKNPDDPNPNPALPSSYEPCWDRLEGPMGAELSIYNELGIHWTYFVGGTQGGKSYGLWTNVATNPTPTDKGEVWIQYVGGTITPP